MKSLRERIRDVRQEGRLRWIGVRPSHGAPMLALEEVTAVADRGLAGDRANGGNRQVTLIQHEHLPIVAGFLGLPSLAPSQLRRNLVVEGLNLVTLNKLRFAVGDAIFVGTGPCAPCGKLDDIIVPGAFQAVRGHGGITARIERGGVIRIGDVVRVLASD